MPPAWQQSKTTSTLRAGMAFRASGELGAGDGGPGEILVGGEHGIDGQDVLPGEGSGHQAAAVT